MMIQEVSHARGGNLLEEHLLLMFMCTVDASWWIGGRTNAYQVVVSESNHYSALQLVNHIDDQRMGPRIKLRYIFYIQGFPDDLFSLTGFLGDCPKRSQ